MELESLRKIDADRLTLVGFYVDDSVRGVENPGLTQDEAEALRLVAAYERANGRDAGIGDGYARAASRLLDNAYDADDGPYETATNMVADLALQRHAAEVVKAAEAFGKDGKEPEGFESFLVEYVIKGDLQSDPEIKADWNAIAEGRFDEASRYVEDVIGHGVRDREHLAEGASSWMYDNEIREELPEFDRRSNLVDVLDLADGPEPYEPTSRDFQEWIAGEPDAHTWDEERHKAESDRFFGRDAEADREPEFITHSQIVQQRVEDMRSISMMPQNVVDEIERLGRDGVSFDDKAIYAGGERLGAMVEADDARAPKFAAALAHAVMSERGASASESSAWMFEERPSLGVSEMLATIDREDGDHRHGLSKGTSERIAMSQAKDSVRGLTSSDRSVDGMVTACELAAEERGVPVDRLIASVAEERRRSDRSFAADSDRVNDAVKLVLRESQVEKALEDRGVRAEAEEKPFFAMPTIDNMDRASRDVGDVSDAIRHSDPTIHVEKSLRMGVATLDAAGLEMDRGTGIDRLEAAWGRVLEMRDAGRPMTVEQEARMVVYDVATQAEAAGIASGMEIGRDEALIGRNLVATMGIRTLTQEQAGPMALNRRELADVAAGNLAALPRGTQAGFSLGASWARDSEGLPLRDVQVEKPRGLMGQAAGAASKGFSRVGAKAPEIQDVATAGMALGGGKGR